MSAMFPGTDGQFFLKKDYDNNLKDLYLRSKGVFAIIVISKTQTM